MRVRVPPSALESVDDQRLDSEGPLGHSARRRVETRQKLFELTPVLLIHGKQWTNLTRQQLSVAKQRSSSRENMLKSSWKRWWVEIGAHGDGAALMQQLLAAYADPQRKYHALQHLSECLDLLEQHRHLAVEPAAVEELSAAGVSTERVAQVREHILATRHSTLPKGQDQQLLVDIDLAILGANRARFEEYEVQVRAEYAWVPELIFRQKRAEVLAEFLAREPIYNTTPLHNALEHQARENLAQSLQQLRDGNY